MKINILQKLLKNKHVLIIGIICLITLSCVSLASAADVDNNNTQFMGNEDPIAHVDVINDTTIENDTEPADDSEHNIWDEYGINPNDYRTPTIYHVANEADLKKAANDIWNAKSNGIDLILLIFDNNNVYSITPWFEYNLLHPTCRMLVIDGNGATVKIKNPDTSDEYHFLCIDESISTISQT